MARADFRAAERLTEGMPTFTSGNHIDEAVAAVLFVFDGPPGRGGGDHSGSTGRSLNSGWIRVTAWATSNTLLFVFRARLRSSANA